MEGVNLTLFSVMFNELHWCKIRIDVRNRYRDIVSR